jgi:hypothetical protein
MLLQPTLGKTGDDMHQKARNLCSVAALSLLVMSGTACTEAPDTPQPEEASEDANGELPSPVASFDYSPETIQVGQPVIFDASASEPVDDSLRFDFTWTFDHGVEATGETTGFIFSRPGEHKVELLADNAGWKSTAERIIQVEPVPTLEEGPAELQVRVVTPDGVPVDSASLSILGRDGTTAVNPDGYAVLSDLPTQRRLTVVADASDISPRYQTTVIPRDVRRATVDIGVRTATAQQRIAIDNSTTIQGDDGLYLRVPSFSFVAADGERLRSGEVQVEVTRLGGARDDEPTLPGSFMGWDNEAARQLRFFGGLDIRAYHDGRPARLAPGRTLEAVLPATYPPTYEGLPVSIVHLEPVSGYWIESGDEFTQLTPHSPTSIGTSVEIPRLGAWALAAPATDSCSIQVRCQDAAGRPLDSCTVLAETIGLDGVGRECMPTSLTEGTRCKGAQNCVNCEEDATSSREYVPSAPCAIGPNGNSVCPNGGAGTRVNRRYCPPDESFVCQPDDSGLGHCIEQELPDCGIAGLFCDVHQSVFVTPTPEQGICSAPQSEFMRSEGLYTGLHILPGSGTIEVPKGRLRLNALGPDALLRGRSAIVGSDSRCPSGVQTILLGR